MPVGRCCWLGRIDLRRRAATAAGRRSRQSQRLDEKREDVSRLAPGLQRCFTLLLCLTSRRLRLTKGILLRLLLLLSEQAASLALLLPMLLLLPLWLAEGEARVAPTAEHLGQATRVG